MLVQTPRAGEDLPTQAFESIQPQLATKKEKRYKKQEDKKGFVGGWLCLQRILPAGPADAIARCYGLWPNKVQKQRLFTCSRILKYPSDGKWRQQGTHPSGIKATSATLQG